MVHSQMKEDRPVKIELSNFIEKYGEETMILLGDFNGHVGFLDDQPINGNGKMFIG